MKFPRILFGMCVVSTMAVWSACGGGSGSSKTPIPPPPPTGTNYTTCDSQQVPNWQSNLFISNYQPAIQALVSHYGGDSRIGYIRVGLGRGGEINLPQGWNQSSSGSCYGGYSGKWGYTVGGGSPDSSTWNQYLSTMVGFEGNLHSGKPLLVSITPVSGTSPSTATDDFIAPLAVLSGLSYGNQGLESSDISSFDSGGPCGGDWCHLFESSPPEIAELQTLGQSCPANTTCANNLATSTGPLPPLLQFATGHTNPAVPAPANDLEIYYEDWLIAYDPDYANSVGASSSSAAYAAAIQAAAATGAQMQVLFPPQPNDSTMCGSSTCYQAVLNYVITNPAAPVTGVVVDVDWSDFMGNSAGQTPDWTITEAAIAPYQGKKINLVLQNTTYGGSGSCPASGIGSNGNVASNCAMPSWMWTVLE